MEIAVQARDLDHGRIDGTRVYLKELLRRFATLRPETLFTLYHADEWNPLLAPPLAPNYRQRKLSKRFAWMQTAFASALYADRPDKLFLPIQAAPFFLPKNLEVTVTIHDLAFKRFPETFPWADRFRLNLMLAAAVRRADKLIAISESTRADLLAFFPALDPRKIRVIHHGFDPVFFSQKMNEDELEGRLQQQGVRRKQYLLFVGALQPRKNLVRLIHAFEKIRKEYPALQLVLCGERAWLSEQIFEAAEQSPAKDAIVFLGKVSFQMLRDLYQGASVFTFPSLYEGFGLPLLEAFASGTPVVTADNSSLREVAGEGALYCDAEDEQSLVANIRRLLSDQALAAELGQAAQVVLKRYAWDKTARETLDYILEKR